MKIASKPISQTFNLECDPEEVAMVQVNQAREGEHLERMDMFSRVTRVYEDSTLRGMGIGDGKLRLQVEQNARRLRRKEAYLTLASLTGFLVEDGGGKTVELFRSEGSVDGRWIKNAMTEDEFNMAWAMLPRDAVEEISQYVLEVNPTWGTGGE